ncbi:MAG TPA: FAD-binding oxidoreductase [Chloroflexia bacterium]|nr:FAD-binding oxidoreductase [Chloroflexia bacterium]
MSTQLDVSESSGHPDNPGAQVPSDDPRYPALVRGFNLRWVGAPKYVQVCGSAEQVRDAVQQALDAGLRVTVRGGGHCYEDFVSNNDGGVIIDLSPLNAVYSPGDGYYAVEGGCTLWNVYTQLFKEYGVTMPAGSCYSVGAGGHVVGGGYGLLSRKYGLVIDYLYAVEVVTVTADRKAVLTLVTRDEDDPVRRELFWAHQGGGGGNFGIVTTYWFKDLPKAPACAYLTTVAWEWADIGKAEFTELVTNYGTFFEQNSGVDSPYKDMFALLHLSNQAAGQISLTVQNVGPDPDLIDRFLEAIEPGGVSRQALRVPVGYLHAAPPPEQTQYLPWLDATQTVNGTGPPRRGKYKSAYMNKGFPPEQIEVLWRYLWEEKFNNSQALVQVDSYGCQINAVPSDATAVPQRSSIMKLQYQTYWTDESDDQQNLDWINGFYNAMYGPEGPMPDGTMDGCYVNYPDVDLKHWQLLYYGEPGYKRLQQVKARWDPLNVFNHKQSIELPGKVEEGAAKSED